jgi:hypothetical protein
MNDYSDIYSSDSINQDIFAPLSSVQDDGPCETVSHDDTPELDPILPLSFFTDTYDPGSGKLFAEMQNAKHTWKSFAALLAAYSKIPRAQKKDSPLYCPTRFTQIVRKRKTPKKIKTKNGRKIIKDWYDGWRCNENVTVSSVIPVDFDDDFAFRHVEDFLSDNDLEGVLYTSASHREAEPHLRLVIPLAGPIDAEMHEIVVNSIIACLKPGYRLRDTTKSTPNSLFYFPGQYQTAEENLFFHHFGEILTAEAWFRRGGLTLQQAVRQKRTVHRRSTNGGGSVVSVYGKDWPLSRDVVWSYDEPRERYLNTKKLRHPALCRFATSTAMCALNAGFDIEVDDLAKIIGVVQDINTSSSPYDDLEGLAGNAINYAFANIDTPAFVLWERQMEEVRQGGFIEPNWPEDWTEQARETICDIQQLRSKKRTMDFGNHYESELDIDTKFETAIEQKHFHSTERPVVNVIGGNLPEEIERAQHLLIESPLPVFQRDGKIVQVGHLPRHKKLPGLAFVQITETALVTMLTRLATWRKFDGRMKDFKVVNCPKEIAAGVLAEIELKLQVARACGATIWMGKQRQSG